MNTAHEHNDYRPEGEAQAAQQPEPQPQPQPEPQSPRVAPTYPAETKRRRGYPYKSAVLAGILSAFPGLGQIYIGYYQRGFAHIALVATLITILSNNAGDLTPLIGVFLAFFWIYNIIDAGRRATLYNQAVDGIDGIDMPKDMKLPKGGSTSLGVVFIVLSLLLLMNTRFDISMAWLEEWWPVGGIILGAWLVYKARKNGNA